MRIRHSIFTAIIAMTVGAGSSLGAEDSATSPQQAEFSPAMKEAISQLNSDDFHERQKAVVLLHEAIARQILAMADVDDEAAAQVHAGLEFSLGVTRWALHMLELPAEQRKAQIAFAQKPEFLSVLSQVYSEHAVSRIEGIKHLAAFPMTGVDSILADIIRGESTAAAVTAMDVAYSRQLNNDLVKALFYRAVETDIYPSTRDSSVQKVDFQGEHLDVPADYQVSRWPTESFIAARVLCHCKPAQLTDVLEGFFNTFYAHMRDAHSGDEWRYTAANRGCCQAYLLAAQCGDPRLLSILYKLATDPQPKILKNVPLFYSSRTPAIAAILQISGKDPHQEGLKYLSRMNMSTEAPTNSLTGVWTFSTEAKELQGIERLKAAAATQPNLFSSPTMPATQ